LQNSWGTIKFNDAFRDIIITSGFSSRQDKDHNTLNWDMHWDILTEIPICRS